MGLRDFFKDIENYATEKYNDKINELSEYVDEMQYKDEHELFEIVYRYTKPGSVHPFNSEGMAARKVLHDMGYGYEEISEKIRQMHKERRR